MYVTLDVKLLSFKVLLEIVFMSNELGLLLAVYLAYKFTCRKSGSLFFCTDVIVLKSCHKSEM